MSVPTPETPTGPSGKARLARLLIVAAVLGAAVGFAAVYGIGGLKRNGTSLATDASCRGAVNAAKKLAPFARGEVAALSAVDEPKRVPDLAFQNSEGKPVKLADFRGRVVLLNLWATWCVPCRKEMPSLDALQAKLGGQSFSVVALNLDTGDSAKPRKFLNDIGIKHLAFYQDPSTNSFQELKRYGRAIIGLPATLLIDRDGCELATLPGPAEWASDDALALLRAASGG